MHRRIAIAFTLIVSLILMGLVHIQEASADVLRDSIPQRIGNYDMELKTDPKAPITNQNTKILLKISSVNGDALVDLPIYIRIAKHGVELEKTSPIVVPYGHYTYNYLFSKAGIYELNVDIIDDPYTGQNITFTFPIIVFHSFLEYLFFSSSYSPLLLAASLASPFVIIGLIFIIRRKKKGQKSIEKTKR